VDGAAGAVVVELEAGPVEVEEDAAAGGAGMRVPRFRKR
jgi:hypothetical protein